jgi:hypothetical protein
LLLFGIGISHLNDLVFAVAAFLTKYCAQNTDAYKKSPPAAKQAQARFLFAIGVGFFSLSENINILAE